ncbi:MAG: hypothetical protein IPM48_01975 [Saprospiraceae bacterium]|nr:hypothetical protein [Saprospiraceae bacterium]
MFNLKFIVIGILVFLVSLTACTNEFESNGQNICFETDVLPVLVSNCTQSGCHNDIDKNERAYIAEENGDWLKAQFQFGFNLSRVFQVRSRKIW